MIGYIVWQIKDYSGEPCNIKLFCGQSFSINKAFSEMGALAEYWKVYAQYEFEVREVE